MSTKKPLKKVPRPERKNSRCRVVSTNFPQGLENAIREDNSCSFVPNKDYMLLLRKYEWLVKRRRKELNLKQLGE